MPTVNRDFISGSKPVTRHLTSWVVAGWLMLNTLATVQAEEIYRWVDADGVVNYTQQKPRDVAAQQLTTQRGAPTRVESAASQVTQAVDADVAAAERNLDDAQKDMLEDLRAAEAARQQEIAKVKEANCQRSRALLSNLSAKEHIRIRDDSGTERVMPEEERQRRIEAAQKGIVDNCASA